MDNIIKQYAYYEQYYNLYLCTIKEIKCLALARAKDIHNPDLRFQFDECVQIANAISIKLDIRMQLILTLFEIEKLSTNRLSL